MENDVPLRIKDHIGRLIPGFITKVVENELEVTSRRVLNLTLPGTYSALLMVQFPLFDFVFNPSDVLMDVNKRRVHCTRPHKG